jgi:hypothetical protein
MPAVWRAFQFASRAAAAQQGPALSVRPERVRKLFRNDRRKWFRERVDDVWRVIFFTVRFFAIRFLTIRGFVPGS